MADCCEVDPQILTKRELSTFQFILRERYDVTCYPRKMGSHSVCHSGVCFVDVFIISGNLFSEEWPVVYFNVLNLSWQMSVSSLAEGAAVIEWFVKCLDHRVFRKLTDVDSTT